MPLLYHKTVYDVLALLVYYVTTLYTPPAAPHPRCFILSEADEARGVERISQHLNAKPIYTPNLMGQGPHGDITVCLERTEPLKL